MLDLCSGIELWSTLDQWGAPLRRAEKDTAVCVEIDSPADMNDAVIEIDYEPILRRKLQRTVVSTEGVEEKYSAPCTDSISTIQNSLISVGRIRGGGSFPPNKTCTIALSKENLRCQNRVTYYAIGGVCHRTALVRRVALQYMRT